MSDSINIDPFKTHKLLCDSYIRYIQTLMGFESEKLEAERDELLRKNGLLFQEPRFEPIFPYPSSGKTLSDLCHNSQLPSELGEFLAAGGEKGLAPIERSLYKHQVKAIKASVTDEKDVVVTTGTGSGKTECFLLPIFSYLIKESRNWSNYGDRNSEHPWWRTRERLIGTRVPQRQGETRPAAIRALILYPLNALVEDQLMRLRRACDSPDSHQWLDDNRGNNRFYFGRYTSLTPVSGEEKGENIRRLRGRLDEFRKQYEKVRDFDEKRYFFPSTDLDTSEMWSRWDMQDHPPDIFITNYSMLNIMLTRDLEQPIFEKTKEWLEKEDSVFHLVVDELHSYRGTAGSEVAYLLRTLFTRLGLDPDSPKLRIIASSASLEGNEGSEYLRQFFARKKDFEIIPSPQIPDHTSELRECLQHAEEFEKINNEAGSARLDNIPKGYIKSAVAQLCNRDGKLHALTVKEMHKTAKEVSSSFISEDAIRGLIRYLIEQKDTETGRALLPLRLHLFFKNFEGLWACSNSKCQARNDETLIGKLFANRRVLCDECGSRVLELLTCETCGDLFVGGYKQPIPNGISGWYLSGDYQKLSELPEKGIRDRNYETYAIFWQKQQIPEPGRPWIKNGINRRWAPARFNPTDGTLIPDSADFNGYFYKIDHPDDSCSEIPKYCPNCGDAWESNQKTQLVNGKEEARSPLHDMGTGLQKIIQILTQTMQATVTEQPKRKTIIFSDSRQDAAKYAVGLQWAHYRDMIRLIVIETMKKQAEDEDLKVIRNFQTPRADFGRAMRHLYSKFPNEERLLESIEDAFYERKPVTPAQENQLIALGDNYPYTVLQKECFKVFINLGMNPGGYGQKVDKTESGDGWQNICNWQSDPIELHKTWKLEPHHERLIENIEFEFKKVIAERILFARKDMSLEGLGLAWCKPKIDLDKWGIENVNPTEIMAAVTRILGERKYTTINPHRYEEKNMPKFVEDYLLESAKRFGCLPEELTRTVGEQIEASSSFDGYLISIEDLDLFLSQGNTIYRCSKCKRKHLYKAGGICTNTKCLKKLEAIDKSSDSLEQYGGYYAYQVDPKELGIEPYRFHCEELTAQTDSEQRPNRQRWFQDVTLDDENKLTDEIDLLSVTTTMEAGVDIGALSIVLLGNVPPQRFNYQQRVGRAGRRGDPIAYALTLCRLRTHDDHYFSHTDEITNDETSQPYLDLRSIDIIKRVLTKEVLFHALPYFETQNENERNIHGNFGKVSDWVTNRKQLSEWIQTNQKTILQIVQVLAAQTELQAQSEMDELINWVTNELEDEISDCVDKHQFKVDDLSQALAESGLLPMFGFPTGVRYLYHKPPQRGDWPPTSGVVDRDIEIAINQFAPGAETIKDKKIHTSIGIVSYIPKGKSLTTEKDIGRKQPIGFCDHCKAVFTKSKENENTCQICDSNSFKLIQGIEPKGFLTNFNPDDAQEHFNWTPRATYSRLPSDAPAKLKKQSNFCWGVESKLQLLSINTNNDQLFKLSKQQNSEALVSAEVCRELEEKKGYRLSKERHLTEDTQDVALYASTTTDILLIEVDEIPIGILNNLQGEYWRAALYSLGFLFRQFAANQLDVSPNELRVEIRPIEKNGNHTQQIFIADSLANGAGYCRYLGELNAKGELRLIEYLRNMTDPDKDFAKGLIAHGDDCDSSCYNKGCMRDYSNMPYHPFLDWRLGLDVAKLCLDKDYQMDLQKDYWVSLVDRVEKNLMELLRFSDLKYKNCKGVPVFESQAQEKAFILHHPLALTGADYAGPHIASVIADYDGTGFKILYINIFDAIRRVSEIVNLLQ
ncbi:MAG: DEAD/DEAH box helicase [Candidatus Poribacteria bacterium]|nr:DEAD/DEAH box helicase [Candidatus Poribacteria bacterium]